MPFLTDLGIDEQIEFRTADGSLIEIKMIKRSGYRVRLSISADKEVEIKKIVSGDENNPKMLGGNQG